MDLNEALGIVEMKTGNTRFRELCNPEHRDHTPTAEAAVKHLAEILSGRKVAGTLPQPIAEPIPGVVEVVPQRPAKPRRMTLAEAVRACPHWSAIKSDCNCVGGKGRCALGYGRDGVVSLADCRECLQKRRDENSLN